MDMLTDSLDSVALNGTEVAAAALETDWILGLTQTLSYLSSARLEKARRYPRHGLRDDGQECPGGLF
jgi:hypothetical protein